MKGGMLAWRFFFGDAFGACSCTSIAHTFGEKDDDMIHDEATCIVHITVLVEFE